ncbi:hypothetical protein PR003_g8095 [Phytophthora rubi]|nr:hypothetical protein PR002_g8110 [Phytophthora rubi]KAE9345140.1 hypothetical protein PR003_g8095 [Phytophthora rubi]
MLLPVGNLAAVAYRNWLTAAGAGRSGAMCANSSATASAATGSSATDICGMYAHVQCGHYDALQRSI